MGVVDFACFRCWVCDELACAPMEQAYRASSIASSHMLDEAAPRAMPRVEARNLRIAFNEKRGDYSGAARDMHMCRASAPRDARSTPLSRSRARARDRRAFQEGRRL